MDSKSDLRLYAKELRKKLDIKSISNLLSKKIQNNNLYINAKNIMIYYPMKYEINLLELTKDNKQFYLPKVDNENLLVCPFDCELKKSNLNIYEPCSNPINPNNLDLIIVPALMTDKDNYRLGYGGGFYDRFLTEYPNIKTICAIPKELCTDKLPRDKWDKKLDMVISP